MTQNRHTCIMHDMHISDNICMISVMIHMISVTICDNDDNMYDTSGDT